MRTLAALLLLTTLRIGAAALAQSAESADCSLAGSVVNSVTDAPIVRARVSLKSSAGDSHVLLTDVQGNWSLGYIACGPVTITATRPGYLALPKDKAPMSIALAKDKPVRDVKVRLDPQAVITGRVVDELRDPIPHARVAVLESRVVNGLRKFEYRDGMDTNDAGEYRIPGLAAGRYVVCAKADKREDAPPYAEQCSLGSPEDGPASAMAIRTGYNGVVDFQLAPISLRSVRGVVSGVPQGANLELNLQSRQVGYGTNVNDDGTFDVSNIPPGSYTLSAVAFFENGPLQRSSAVVPVQLSDQDIEGLRVHLEPLVNVTGTVRVVSTIGTAIGNPQYVATLSSAWGDLMTLPELRDIQGVWDEKKTTFVLPNVLPGSHRFAFAAPAPFYVKRVIVGGRETSGHEVTIEPGAPHIEVELSDDGGVVEGDVFDGDAPAEAWLLLHRNGETYWSGRANAEGHFKVECVPPGDYVAYAWNDNATVEYANPAWMQLNAKGVAFTIQPSETTRIKLTRQIAQPD